MRLKLVQPSARICWVSVNELSSSTAISELLGGGSVGIAWGQEPTPKTDNIKDYGFRPGVAIEELLGVKKINFNGVQNGIVTMFVGAAADS